MSVSSLVYPMAAMFLVTVVVLVRLFRSRVAAVRAGQVEASYFRLYQGGDEPESTRKVSRHFTNLFEAPTLFYVCLLYTSDAADERSSVDLGGRRIIKKK